MAGFNGIELQSLRHLLRKCHLPLHKGGCPPGYLEIPLPSPSVTPSPLGRLIRSAEGGGRIPPVLTKGQNHPPLTRGAIALVEGGGEIPTFDKRGFFGLFFTKTRRKVYELWSVEI